MAHRVKCYYCGITFDRDKVVDCVKVNGSRYAHLECHLKAQDEKTQEEKDLEALEQYIIELLRIDYINPRVRKQINDFKAQYNYSYTGMLKSLKYFYEVKKNDVSKAKGGIGIIPYIYQDAWNYYYHIWVANQSNQAKPVEQYQPQERVIKIPIPKRVEKKKKLFSFLEEEE